MTNKKDKRRQEQHQIPYGDKLETATATTTAKGTAPAFATTTATAIVVPYGMTNKKSKLNDNCGCR
jgi:hypothetical protein